MPGDIYGLLTKLVRSRWLDIGGVLFCVFMDRDGVEVHKHSKKERGYVDMWLSEKFFLRDKAASPERAR